MPDFNEFSVSLRGALKHLYDPDFLRRSSLAGWFGVADRYDTPSLVQSILIKSIEAMRPAQNPPLFLSEQQNYDVLLYRFIQQSDQVEVAHQLGVSPRQLRRIQAIALEALAAVLWKTYGKEGAGFPAGAAPPDAPGDPSLQRVTDDFAWLKTAPVTDPAIPEEITQKSLALLQPLAERHNVRLSYRIGGPLPALAVHPIALRQILLSLLGETIRTSSGFNLEVGIEHVRAEVCFSIRRSPPAPEHLIDPESKGVLDARQIALLSNGRLETIQSGEGMCIQLCLPAIDQIKIVAIDDNADIIALLQRYLDGTRYILIGGNRALDALALIQREKPRMILLDVMIPELDGWELLGQLHRDPSTTHIPIIICSILAQEELASTLGAADFIQKPVRREILLQVLERVAAKLAQESP
jgi:CheY-like chemotaxis protein